MKKILHIIPSFDIGGAEKVVLDYLLNGQQSDYEVMAISLYKRPDNHYAEVIDNKGLDVYYLDKKAGLDFTIFRKLKNKIEAINPDVIHTHMHSLKYIIGYIKEHPSKRYVHTIHNEPNRDAKGIHFFINKIMFKKYKVTPIALTKKLSRTNNSYYDISNTETLNNGIKLDEFELKTKNDLNKIKNDLGISKDEFVLGHVGRFNEQKNHTFIIDVFVETLKKRENSVLLLIGDGYLRNEIEMKVRKLGVNEKVKFLGVRQDVFELLSVMDVFLFPSIHEGFPITLIEAQATGIRCVVSDKIDSDSFLLDTTVALSLKDSSKEWSKAVLNEDLLVKRNKNISDCDIKSIMKQLYCIYGLVNK